MTDIFEKCTLCPRACNVNRTDNETGFCGQSTAIRVARASLHMWEEPCISGTRGSGTIFFSGCSLGCVFCQNKDISRGTAGHELTVNELANVMLKLQDMGALNINLVTPGHFAPQIAGALKMIRPDMLHIPVVYNTSSYENVETLKMLDGLVDIYLPDFKYYDDALAQKYSNAPGYFHIASEAIDEMFRQVGEPRFGEDEIMQKGIIVRHLILPGCTEDSKKIIRCLYDRYGDAVYLSIMNQYTPVGDLAGFPELTRKVTDEEYDNVVDYAIELGVENAFIQEGDTAEESFIPDFNEWNPEEFLGNDV